MRERGIAWEMKREGRYKENVNRSVEERKEGGEGGWGGEEGEEGWGGER